MPEKPPSLRERQAQLTRDEILTAARRLFAERGYTRTSVRDIAEAAGVSAQTVYDIIDDEAGIGAIAGKAAQSTDPVEVAATSAKVTRSILEHCGDVIHALVTGAAAEPDLERVLTEGHRRHVEGAGFVVGALERLDALDSSLDRDDAVATLAAISDVQFALLLRERYG